MDTHKCKIKDRRSKQRFSLMIKKTLSLTATLLLQPRREWGHEHTVSATMFYMLAHFGCPAVLAWVYLSHSSLSDRLSSSVVWKVKRTPGGLELQSASSPPCQSQVLANGACQNPCSLKPPALRGLVCRCQVTVVTARLNTVPSHLVYTHSGEE